MVIYTYKGYGNGTFDVTGAYLHFDLPKDKHVLLKLRGDLVEIMCVVNTENIKNVVYYHGKRFYIYYFYDPSMAALNQHFCGMSCLL